MNCNAKRKNRKQILNTMAQHLKGQSVQKKANMRFLMEKCWLFMMMAKKLLNLLGFLANRVINRQNIKIKKIPDQFGRWGKPRVWLEPSKETNTYGRSGFSIHGGEEPGSAGCIDLTSEMPGFADWFKKNGKDLIVEVEY